MVVDVSYAVSTRELYRRRIQNPVKELFENLRKNVQNLKIF